MSNLFCAHVHRSRSAIARLACNYSNRNMSGHSSNAPAKDMPAAAALNSMDQVRQEQDFQGQQQQQPQQQQQQQAPLAPCKTWTQTIW
jgi:hypothetical protein